jgi:hypothetical protein
LVCCSLMKATNEAERGHPGQEKFLLYLLTRSVGAKSGNPPQNLFRAGI